MLNLINGSRDEESAAIDFSGKSLRFSVMNPKTCGKTWTGTTFSISRAVGGANVPETWEIMGSTNGVSLELLPALGKNWGL